MIETNPRRTCVLVLGMHRSGTSAIARMISLLGAGLPKSVIGADVSNAAGHWEPRVLVDLDEEMLLAGGSAWNDWRPFDPATALGPERLAHYSDKISRGIEDQFEGQTLFVLKDPRICRFAPLYLEALARLGIGVKVVLMSRRPAQVAASLLERDQMPRDHAIRLWLRHNLDAEAATRDVERLVISYESAMDDPDTATARLQALLASAISEGARIDLKGTRASLRRELRHHGGAAPPPSATDALGRWAETAVAAFDALEADGSDERSQATLTTLGAQLDEDLRSNGPDLAYCLRDAVKARAELVDMTRQRDAMFDRERQLEKREWELEMMVRTRETWLQQLRETLADQRRRHIVELAGATRPDFGDELPKQLSPWRSLNAQKRKRTRERREDYLAVLASPLFDADHYLKTYPDVAERGDNPVLHYLSHGSSEGRWPSASVDPKECMTFFPEIREGEGNLVLRLIALLGPEPDDS